MEAVADFIKAFNPNQPRDAHGRFGEVADALGGVARAAGAAAATVASVAFHHAPHIDPKKFAHPDGVTESMIKSALGGRLLNHIERSVLRTYVQNGAAINAALRTKDPKFITGEMIDKAGMIASAIARSKLPENMRLVRGVSGDLVKSFEPGKIVHDVGFMSTTLDKSIAQRFAWPWEKEQTTSEGALVRIYAKKGATALPLPNDLHHWELQEVLLPRDSKLKILKKEKSGLSIPERPFYNIYAELL